MGLAVIFSAQANRDLGEIVRFLARKNPAAAVRLGDALVDRALALAAHPYLGPPLRGRPDIRRIVDRRWFIIYYRVQVSRGSIEIVRIWDGRRNPGDLRWDQVS